MLKYYNNNGIIMNPRISIEDRQERSGKWITITTSTTRCLEEDWLVWMLWMTAPMWSSRRFPWILTFHIWIDISLAWRCFARSKSSRYSRPTWEEVLDSLHSSINLLEKMMPLPMKIHQPSWRISREDQLLTKDSSGNMLLFLRSPPGEVVQGIQWWYWSWRTL